MTSALCKVFKTLETLDKSKKICYNVVVRMKSGRETQDTSQPPSHLNNI